MRNQFEIHATLVADEFIDTYMASANGEYVKVYLYILRHQNEKVDLPSIADALNHTEADVRRALAYWEKMGVLGESGENAAGASQEDAARASRGNAAHAPRENAVGASWENPSRASRETAAAVTGIPSGTSGKEAASASSHFSPMAGRNEEAAGGRKTAGDKSGISVPEKRKSYGKAELDRLQGDGEFSQLLYVAGQYMGRLLKPQDADMLAYLYDTLRMPSDVIEYVIEYCVQNRHNSIRYMETVALNWHEKGIDTVAKAKAWTEHFNQDAFAVMKAFGINDRRPGNTEWDTIERWYKTWGFSRQMVVEACNRTMEAIHKPSFQYADRILEEWHKNGLRTLEEVAGAESRRKRPAAETKKRSNNQFHNFEERQTDYDAMILEQWQ